MGWTTKYCTESWHAQAAVQDQLARRSVSRDEPG
jgi:hypothetical protein